MIPELEKAFESVKSRYESGQAGFQELVETESRLLNFKNLQIDAEFETLKLKADIIFDLGKIFPEQES
jgi:outer membrane protein TolC